MIRFIFIFFTVILGILLQVILGRYLSLYDAQPQVLLLLVVANGFLLGPVMGVTLGFVWGILSDASGVRLFGINTFLLALAGYLSGQLRRRVASERMTSQLVLSLVASLYYAVGVSTLYRIFDESGRAFSFGHFILEAIYNALFVTVFFAFTERWAASWRIQSEHM